MRIYDMGTVWRFVPEELADVTKEDGALYIEVETSWNQYARALVFARYGVVPLNPWRLCSPALRHVDEHGHETLCVNCTSPDQRTMDLSGLTAHVRRVRLALAMSYGP